MNYESLKVSFLKLFWKNTVELVYYNILQAESDMLYKKKCVLSSLNFAALQWISKELS